MIKNSVEKPNLFSKFPYFMLNSYCQALTGWNQQNFVSEFCGVCHTLRMQKMEAISHKTHFRGIFYTVVLAGTYKYRWLIMG